MISGTKSSWMQVTSDVFQELILVLVLFSIFINDLEDGRECALSKFAGGAKLGVAAMSGSCVTIQRDLCRLEKQVNRNLMQLGKGKCWYS